MFTTRMSFAIVMTPGELSKVKVSAGAWVSSMNWIDMSCKHLSVECEVVLISTFSPEVR